MAEYDNLRRLARRLEDERDEARRQRDAAAAEVTRLRRLLQLEGNYADVWSDDN